MLGNYYHSSFCSFFKNSYIMAFVKVKVLFHRQLLKVIPAKAWNFYILSKGGIFIFYFVIWMNLSTRAGLGNEQMCANVSSQEPKVYFGRQQSLQWFELGKGYLPQACNHVPCCYFILKSSTHASPYQPQKEKCSACRTLIKSRGGPILHPSVSLFRRITASGSKFAAWKVLWKEIQHYPNSKSQLIIFMLQ